MTKFLENILKKISDISYNNIFNMHLPHQITEAEKKNLEKKYVDWIMKRFVFHRLSLITEINLPNSNETEVFISHWIPFMFEESNVDISEQEQNTWSSVHKSININLLPSNPYTFHRNPVANSTDGIRGNRGYSEGIHIWEINWPLTMRGTHAVVGVSTEKCQLQQDRYVSLVGIDDESWGWDIVNRIKVHGKETGNPICYEKYPDVKKIRKMCSMGKSFKIPSRIYLILDMYQGSLSFVIGNEFLGICHMGLKGKTLYPTVSAVWGHCQVEIKYFGCLSRRPPSLRNLSAYQFRRLVRHHCRYNELRGQQGRFQTVTEINSSTNVYDAIMNQNVPNCIKDLLLNNETKVLRF
uniref:F-box/SPRY-domain protein 1 n=1 Tax=Dugesia ryukyuensis TaxID=79738 RepID=A7M6E3_DUGRY|nr:F-box/SPRY-domain protein 1 [Dugesia ryukyuensis]